MASPVIGEVAADAVFGLGTLLVPTAIGVALLRYRLCDIDRVIRRTVADVTALLAAVYAAGVLGVGEFVPTRSNDLVVAGSALAAAGFFQPVRRRVQVAVDRRFTRARYDTQGDVSRLADRLRRQVELDGVVDDDLADTVDRLARPATVSLGLLAGADR